MQFTLLPDFELDTLAHQFFLIAHQKMRKFENGHDNYSEHSFELLRRFINQVFKDFPQRLKEDLKRLTPEQSKECFANIAGGLDGELSFCKIVHQCAITPPFWHKIYQLFSQQSESHILTEANLMEAYPRAREFVRFKAAFYIKNMPKHIAGPADEHGRVMVDITPKLVGTLAGFQLYRLKEIVEKEVVVMADPDNQPAPAVSQTPVIVIDDDGQEATRTQVKKEKLN